MFDCLNYSQAKMNSPGGATKSAKTGGLICELCCSNMEQCPSTDLIFDSSLLNSPHRLGAVRDRLGVADGIHQLLWLPDMQAGGASLQEARARGSAVAQIHAFHATRGLLG